jgi:hypothetical protein
MSKLREHQRSASYLLPEPGGEVVRELLDDIAALEQRISELNCARQCEGAAFRIEYKRGLIRQKELEDRISELEQLANEAIDTIEDMAGGPCCPSIEYRKRLEPPQ